MIRRIPEFFVARDVPESIGSRLFEIPLRDYAANCWYGGAYVGEPPAAIRRTRGTDALAHCLAFATMHVGGRIAESGIRGYDVLGRREGGRQASRIAGLFATHAIDCVTDAMSADEDAIGFRERDPRFEISQAQYRGVAEIMYPDSREMRASVARRDGDSLDSWSRALDHALFIEPGSRGEPQIDATISLVGTIRDTLESFYLYFLATAYGDDVYQKYGI